MAGPMIVRGSAPPPDVVPRLAAGTRLLPTRESCPQLPRKGRESCRVEIALIKANSSCLIMMLRQELLYTT